MWSTMSLIIGPGDVKVEVGVFCGWETASSQIRMCIVLSAIYNTFLAYRSVMNESKSLADRVSENEPSLIYVIFLVFTLNTATSIFAFHYRSF
jgi:hypothetical protein